MREMRNTAVDTGVLLRSTELDVAIRSPIGGGKNPPGIQFIAQ